MREILFRGQDENGVWYEGDLIQYREERVVIMPQKEGLWDILEASICVKKETVGQYTGLKDKNGKKIFEGDILKFRDGRSFETDIVKYSDIHAHYFCGNCSLGSTTIEVIGNIHDNPELLEA